MEKTQKDVDEMDKKKEDQRNDAYKKFCETAKEVGITNDDGTLKEDFKELDLKKK